MEVKVKDLTASEFKELIASTVRETMDELSEDAVALSSDNYLASIREARKDCREGNLVAFEDMFDV